MLRPMAMALLCLGLGACALSPGSAPPVAGAERSLTPAAALRLRVLMDSYLEDDLKLAPWQAIYYDDWRFLDRFDADLDDSYLAARATLERRYLAAVEAIDAKSLQGEDRLAYEVFRRDREMEVAGLAFPWHLLPLNQYESPANDFAQLGSGESTQPFQTVEHYQRFLRKADGFSAWVDQAIERLKEGRRRGIVLPRVLVERMLPQLQELGDGPPEQSVFWGPISRFPANFSATDRQRLAEAYRQKIATVILPAYRRLHAMVRDDYLPYARRDAGLGGLPGGAAWYSHLVRLNTTTDLSPAQIHRLGLDEVARLRAEMEKVRQRVGFQGDLHQFFDHLKTDPRYYYRRGDEVIAGYQALKARINARLPQLFATLPKQDYVIREVEAFRAASAAGASYEPGSPDGSRPGVFFVNTIELSAQPKFGMETLSLHEAAPGHHFQNSVLRAQSRLSKYQRYNGYVAYGEGWALYAETLGPELGLFQDPYQYYGHLSDAMLRAMRLVVDTGLHAYGWSRERAIAYMRDNSSMSDEDIVREVERYMADPGQALAYKIGQMKIRELRNEAERRLGKRFDVRQFHDQVLLSGELPMAVLESKIRQWIASQEGKRAG
ncbi:DUF885 domain-containing protein [Chitinimonas lacunae]|uniref:DUF885 domain-containing protein n=1 Tax=Chitinimonas lacunae TaxID=1963018 RepID=A0ABV8MTK6_9NEIS